MQKTSSAAARVQANLPELFKGKLTPGNAYIKFQLTSDMTALLSMDQVQESSIVKAEQITALPRMPKSVIGMISSRDRVFCVFDLAQLLMLSSELITSQQYQLIVLQTTTEPPINVGLAVNQLQGIIRLTDELIQSSLNGVSSELVPYLSGVLQQDETVIPVLKYDRLWKALRTVS